MNKYTYNPTKKTGFWSITHENIELPDDNRGLIALFESAVERLRDLSDYWESPAEHDAEMKIYDQAIADAKSDGDL